MTLGQKIKKLRTEKGFTQKELADKVFVTFQTVSKWEKDENEPDVSTLRELAKLFGCTMDYLLSEEEIVEPKEEEKPAVVPVPVAPVEQVTKTVVIHQRELHVCEYCKKDIPEDELELKDVIVTPSSRGHSAITRPGYFHRECLNKINQQAAEAKERARREMARRAKIKSFGWSIPAGVGTLVIFMISLLTSGQYNPGVAVLVSIFLGYAAFATVYCILSGSYIEDTFLSIASWSIHLPGVIFTFDLEGLLFLIVVKLLFVVLGFFFGLFVIVLAAVVAAFLSVISFPFILVHNIRTNYANACL